MTGCPMTTHLMETDMDDFNKDIIAFIKKYGCEDTDNYGQIVIYTGLMYDEDDNIVQWKDGD